MAVYPMIEVYLSEGLARFQCACTPLAPMELPAVYDSKCAVQTVDQTTLDVPPSIFTATPVR